MAAFARIVASSFALILASPVLAQAGDEPPSEAGTAEPTETLSLQRMDERLTLSVDIGPHGPYDFLVDTGSEATVIAREVADRLGMVPHKSHRLISISGSTQADAVMIDELVVGSRRIRDLPATVIEGEDIGAEGIIGIQSLRDQRVTLDFRKRTIEVGPSPGRLKGGPNEIVVTAKRRDHRLIVKRATLGGRSIDVVIDTGASFTIANTALRDRYFSRTPVLTRSQMTDVLGNERPVDIINAGELKIDRLRIGNTMVAIADTQIFEELGLTERPAILLGMNHLRLFRRIAVDFQRRQISFELKSERG